MSNKDVIMILGYATPMVAAMVCLVILFVHSRSRLGENSATGMLGRLMIGTNATQSLAWIGIVLYYGHFKGFVCINTFFYAGLLLNQVMLYHFVYTLTQTSARAKFSLLHYLIPLLITVPLGVWSLFVPFEAQYYIVASRGENAPEYEAFSVFFSSPAPMFLLYNLIYSLKSLRRIGAYRKAVINYSADGQRSSMRWLYQFFLLTFFTLPFPVSMLFLHKGEIFNSPYSLIITFMPTFQYIIICYHMVVGNYVLIAPPDAEDAMDGQDKMDIVSRKQFEKYIREKKPYLNPKLKITDMMVEMNTNRSYLSAFINREYGMNFIRYINYCRFKELDALRVNPANLHLSGLELVLMAGFSSYRSYVRAKKTEDNAELVRL